MPLSFMPPKGAISVEMMPSLMPTMPYSSDIAAVEIGSQPEFGVVGHPDHFVVGLEAVQRRHRPEGLLPGDDHVGRHIGQYGRLEKGAAQGRAFAAGHDFGAFFTASAMCASTFSTAFMSISGLITAPGSNPSPTFIASAVSASR